MDFELNLNLKLLEKEKEASRLDLDGLRIGRKRFREKKSLHQKVLMDFYTAPNCNKKREETSREDSEQLLIRL